MKDKKTYYVNLLLITVASISIIAGVLMAVLCESQLNVVGLLLITLSVFCFYVWLVRVLGMRAINKEKAKEERELEKLFDDTFKAFQDKTDYPETNTIKLVESGMEFFAEGRYVCEKGFKNIQGYHLAFEINSTKLKHKPEDYDDVCDLESVGVLIAVGYHDGEALEKYANDNGIILQDATESSVGQSIALKHDKGYSFYIRTAEFDEIDFGFVKILKCENDVLTVYFLLDVPFGLNDMVEGTVELKRETGEESLDINSLISKIKRKRYNVIEVGDEEVQSIKQANPFLPESYIAFLKEVGFADMDWIDIGWNRSTPTNLDDDEMSAEKDVFASFDGLTLDDFYFFGIDNSGSYYAFSRKADDKKVYSFSENAPRVFTYESFEEFLSKILSV